MEEERDKAKPNSESRFLAAFRLPFRKFNAWADSSPIVKFLEHAGRFTVVVALVFFLLESDNRKQARVDAQQSRVDAAWDRLFEARERANDNRLLRAVVSLVGLGEKLPARCSPRVG